MHTINLCTKSHSPFVQMLAKLELLYIQAFAASSKFTASCTTVKHMSPTEDQPSRQPSFVYEKTMATADKTVYDEKYCVQQIIKVHVQASTSSATHVSNCVECKR